MSVEFLRATPLFNGLSHDNLQEVASILRAEDQPDGSTIFQSGEPCEELYLLHNGFVRLLDPNGLVLATLGPGSLLGEAEFLRGLDYSTSAVAATAVQMWALPDVALRYLLQHQVHIGIKLGQNFGEQITQLEDYLVEQLADTQPLGDLPRKILWHVAQHIQPYTLQEGSLLYEAGNQAEGLFLLEWGNLELQPTPTSEDPDPVGQLIQPGTLFGISSLLTNKPYDATAYAEDDCLLWVLPTDAFYSLSSQFPLLRRTLSRRSRLSIADQAQAVVRLAQTPIFAELEPTHLQAIAQQLVLQHIPAGEPIYRIDDNSDALFLIDQGQVRLTVKDRSGVDEELQRINVGSYFGAMSLLTGQNRSEDATATRDTNLWVLYKADLDELVSHYPIMDSVLKQAVSHLNSQQETVNEERFRRFPVLADLSASDLREVLLHLRPFRFPAGQQVYRAGAPGDALYFIEEGHVRLQSLSGAGSWTRSSGDIFGEKAALTNEVYGQSAFTETDLDVLYIKRNELEILMNRFPSLALNLRQLLSQRVAEDNEPRRTYAGSPTQSGQPAQAPDLGADAAPGPQRVGFGAWFANHLSLGAKLRLVLLVLLLIYLFGVAAPLILDSY